MQIKKNPIRLLLGWAGHEKYWMYLAVVLSFFSGLCMMIPYYGVYQLIDTLGRSRPSHGVTRSVSFLQAV